MTNKLYGYDFSDGKLVVNEFEAEIVKWFSSAILKYREHPPVCLVEAVMGEYYAEHGEELTYKEAEQKVAYETILYYMTDEINLKYRLFKKTMKNILAMPFDEVKDITNDIVPYYKDEEIFKNRIGEILSTPISRIVPEHHCEDLVSKELFEAAQMKIKEENMSSEIK